MLGLWAPSAHPGVRLRSMYKALLLLARPVLPLLLLSSLLLPRFLF